MGDRGNIKINDEGQIYLYSHWGGSELKQTLAKALDRGRDRWDDGSYLCRIIFCEMIDGDTTSTTGFGISTYETDNEHPIINVNVNDNTVVIGEDSWSFEDFIVGNRKD